MHPVAVTKEEIAMLKEARITGDWQSLPSFKLKYLYQRIVAFPKNDIAAVKDIAAAARQYQSDRIPF